MSNQVDKGFPLQIPQSNYDNMRAMDSEASRPEITSRSQHWTKWFVRKRVPLTLVSFIAIISFDLLVRRNPPMDPLDFRQLGSAVGTCVVSVGIAIRSWSAGMLKKSEVLATSGPYALVRNPLYVGSFLMMFGFCLLLKDWLALAFVIGPMALLYWYQVMSEEKYMAKIFSESWPSYRATTGRFFPKNLRREVLVPWSLSRWIKNEEYQAFFSALLALVVLHFFTGRIW
ncbi:MAG: isoprenylcysteine carboxylmethyltransferase family protein [Pirellulaceae bacterium]|nr:isoprenylcysteine carboxylmethyltransferase family protein [Pirellulaceae bacterium]